MSEAGTDLELGARKTKHERERERERERKPNMTLGILLPKNSVVRKETNTHDWETTR
jgi:hypothetical protein